MMKEKMKKALVIFAGLFVIVSSVAGCGKGDAGSDLNGTITLNGSTSMNKLANALKEGYMAANPGVTVNVEFTGSGTGIQAAIDGTADIGNSSRALKDEELQSGLEENIVAGSYMLSRPFVMATKGEIAEQSELVQLFFAYIESEEGQAIIKQVGLILPE